MNVLIHEYERVDDLHRNGLKLIQNPKLFCFGVDAVLLTSIVRAEKGEVLLDLGTGTGILPILLTAKTQADFFTGLEIQQESVEIARRSVELNELCNKVRIDHGDIKEACGLYKAASFDVVTVNPPYMNSGGGLLNPYSPKAIARHEILCSLEDIIKNSSKLLKTNGRFYMVHRPHRLADIMVLLRQYALEPKLLRFIHPYVHKEPNMILIEAVRNGKPMVKIMPPLIIYNENKEYTDEVYDIYYKG